MRKKFSDYDLVLKDIVAVVVSSIVIYLLYIKDYLAVLFFSIAVLISLMIYVDYEVVSKYTKRKNKREIIHLFRISTVSAIVLLLVFPFYFMNFNSFDFNLIFGIILIVDFVTLIWSTIELIREEFKI